MTDAKDRTSDGYSRARVVELYDAHATISVNGDDSGLGDFTYFTYRIGDESIKNLIKYIGVDVYPTYHKSKSGKNIEDDLFIEIEPHQQDISASNLSEIYARVDAPGALSLRVFYKNDEGEDWLDEYTYHGRFSVSWWEAKIF